MSAKTATATAAGVVFLTAPAHIARVSAIGAAGAYINLYDSQTGKTWAQPAITNGVQPIDNAFVRTTVAAADQGGVDRIYVNTGLGKGTPSNIAANGTAALPVAGSLPAGAVAVDVDLVMNKGTFIEAPAGDCVVMIEYFPNIADF